MGKGGKQLRWSVDYGRVVDDETGNPVLRVPSTREMIDLLKERSEHFARLTNRLREELVQAEHDYAATQRVIGILRRDKVPPNQSGKHHE